MPALLAVPPALPPLIGCTVALCALLLGLHTLRSGATPPLLVPLLRLSRTLAEAPQRSPAEAARLYGWALVYAGTFGVIVAGGQVLRLVLMA